MERHCFHTTPSSITVFSISTLGAAESPAPGNCSKKCPNKMFSRGMPYSRCIPNWVWWRTCATSSVKCPSSFIVIGIEADLLVSTALVDTYSKCGEVTDAWEVFNSMTHRNVVSSNAMITGYARYGMDKDALVLYDRMLKENSKPDNITFAGVLSACNHACLIEDGWRYFNSISKLHGMKLSLDHFACMINLLGCVGNVNEAVKLIETMPDKPTPLIWSTLLSVCRINKYIKHAEIAARNLFELEPLDAGPYIMLSNMYPLAGRWDDVAYMRSLIKEGKIRKLAAYSWIEVNNKVHKFVSDDRTHSETRWIYEELINLIAKLREEGFVSDTNLVLHDVGEKVKAEFICYHNVNSQVH